MAAICGLIGLRPEIQSVKEITCPPYDVIKPGTKLESVLKDRKDSLYYITLGEDPVGALERLLGKGALQIEEKPCFYVYEQVFGPQRRLGVLTATRVSQYREGKIIRHEKTFDDKVKGRLALRKRTGYTFEPVFLLTKNPLGQLLEKITGSYEPLYHFTSDFKGASELHDIENRIFRVEEDSEEGLQLINCIGDEPLYIADGHHRYHAALLNGQTHCMAYICQADHASIQAYNRVIKGLLPFSEIVDRLDIESVETFETPGKHEFALYTKKGPFLLKAKDVPKDAIGRLDCSILEKELYPLLGLSHDMIMDSKYFDYYPEAELDKMVDCVDSGKYDLAVALHPVSSGELLAVADAGIKDSKIVMPEKSTFFAPKILSGLFIYKHEVV